MLFRSRSVTNGRPPLVWDNTPVNDALMSEALHLGPYTGRDPALRTHVAGVLVNPMQFARASRPTIASALAWCQGRDHLAAWRTVVDSLGLRILAEATAFPDDPHWPGARPTAEWWTSVANIDPELALAAVESDIRPWVDAARDGARLALAALSADIDPDRSTRARFGLAWQWREWSRRPVLTFGRGPRLRPVAANDTSGRFVADPRSFDLSTSLVDDLVLRALRTG